MTKFIDPRDPVTVKNLTFVSRGRSREGSEKEIEIKMNHQEIKREIREKYMKQGIKSTNEWKDKCFS